jgi:hypothetical protein
MSSWLRQSTVLYMGRNFSEKHTAYILKAFRVQMKWFEVSVSIKIFVFIREIGPWEAGYSSVLWIKNIPATVYLFPMIQRDKLLLDWAWLYDPVSSWLALPRVLKWISGCYFITVASAWIPPAMRSFYSALHSLSCPSPTCFVYCSRLSGPNPLRIQLILATSKKSDCTWTYNLYERGADRTPFHFRFSTIKEKLYGRRCHF